MHLCVHCEGPTKLNQPQPRSMISSGWIRPGPVEPKHEGLTKVSKTPIKYQLNKCRTIKLLFSFITQKFFSSG